MRIGEKLYCYREYSPMGLRWFTEGKYYTIFGIHNEINISIIDDDKDENHFLVSDIKNYFLTEKMYRKLKLKKLNESR